MIKRLKEECYITMGQSPKGDTYNTQKKGMPFLQGRRTFGKIYPTIDTWTTNPIRSAQKDSILMSVRAPVGDINIADKNVCIGRGLCSLEMKNGNNKYLYYLLLNNMDRIKNKSTGTIFDSINSKDIENFELKFHTEEDQNKIVKILFNIDNKIELNNSMNDNLQRLSQELYKRWFIDFEFPNEEDKPYKSSGGEFAESEVGEIPTGWGIGFIDDSILTKIIKPGIKAFDFEKRYLATADVEDIFINNYEKITYNERPSRANMQPVYNSIWFAKMQDSIKNILVDNNCNDLVDKYIFSTGFMGVSCIDNSTYYIWNYINNSNFSSLKSNLSTGTLMAGLSNSVMNNFKYIIPSKNVMLKFNDAISNNYKIIKNSVAINNNLIKLRNVLLPKLMNGEVELDKIEI